LWHFCWAMTTEQQKSADSRAPAGQEASSETSDLDTLLQEYEKDGKPQTALKAVKPIIDFARKQMAKDEEQSLADDLNSACSVLKEAEGLAEIDNKLLVGFMESFARDNPAFRKAFSKRTEDPDAWQAQLLKGREWLEGTIKENFKPKTSDVEAAKAAVKGTTETADSKKGPDPNAMLNMNGVEWRKFMDSELGKAL
jgi:hypothetical protein